MNDDPKNSPDSARPRPSYPRVEASPNFPEIERRILERWEREDAFRTSVAGRPTMGEGGTEYVFYDGPPFANGLPHFGHLLTSYAKDVVPRYQTMRGKRVERRFGWDCHGLPAELEAERQLARLLCDEFNSKSTPSELSCVKANLSLIPELQSTPDAIKRLVELFEG